MTASGAPGPAAAAGVVEVGAFVDGARVRGMHWLVAALGAAVTLIDGIDLASMGMVVPSVSAEWGLAPEAFSGVLSAALVGVLFGSAIAGALGDAIGRRWTLIAMVSVCAVFMVLTAFAQTVNELLAYRFLTGFGAGGSIPVAIALTAEYMPERRRNTFVTLMYAGAPLGTTVGGFIGPTLIEAYGWQGVFVAGGAATAGVAVLLLLFLPESMRFLVSKGRDPERVRRLAARLRPESDTPDAAFVIEEETHVGSSLRELFGDRQTAVTLVVWVVFVANQFQIFYLLWLPTVLTQAGLALATALFLLAIFNLGGALGGPALGWVSDRVSAQRVLTVAYPVASVGIGALGFAVGAPAVLPVLAFVAGAASLGASLCLGPLTASLYPTRARSTGVGWALSVGRAGSIAAPLLGGAVLAAGPRDFFLGGAVAPVVAMAGIVTLSRLTRPRTGAGATGRGSARPPR